MSDGPSDDYPEGRPPDDEDGGDGAGGGYDDGYGSEEFDPDSPLQGSFQVSHLTARMPEFIGAGEFANALMVLAGPMEVILDFVQRLSEPNRVVARVVIPPQVARQFAATLRQNIERYEEVFGELPQLPRPIPTEPPDEPAPPAKPDPVVGATHAGEGGGGGIVGAGVPESGGGAAAGGVPFHGAIEPGRRVNTPGIDDIYRDLRIADEMMSGRYANAVVVRHTPAEFAFDFITRFVPNSAVSSRVIVAAPNVASMLNSLEHSVRGKYDF